jgi:hypothetical protein
MNTAYEYIPLENAPVDEEGLLWCPEFHRHFVGKVVIGFEKRIGVASGALGVEFTHFCRYPKPPTS